LDSSPEHPTLVGEELAEFDGVGLSFYSTLLGHRVEPGKWSYNSFDWTLKNADEAWQKINQINARYYVFRNYNPALDGDVFNHLSNAEFDRIKRDPEFRFSADKSNERVLVYERIPGVSNPVPAPSARSTFSGVNPLEQLPFGLLEYPKMGAPVNGRQVLPILGWVAAPSAISQVRIAMDGGRGIEAAKQNRPDVAEAYPKMKSTGYKAELDAAYFADGNHRITVTAYIQDGSSRLLADVSADIHFDFPGVSQEANHPFGLLEYPKIGTSVTGKTFSILGWTVVPSGLGSIEILLDGRRVRDADRYSRPDVSNAYPGVPSTGFKTEVDLTSAPAGAHRISVISRGKDGLSRILAQVSVIRQAG
jgi:hypothetical protein